MALSKRVEDAECLLLPVSNTFPLRAQKFPFISSVRLHAFTTQFIMSPWNFSKSLALFSLVEENHPYAHLNPTLLST